MTDTNRAEPMESTAPASDRDPHFGGHSYDATMLRDLLAVIHADGGHYVAEHGIEKAATDAQAKYVALTAEVEASRLPLAGAAPSDGVQQLINSLKDAARHLLQSGLTKQGIAVQACVTMLEDDSDDDLASVTLPVAQADLTAQVVRTPGAGVAGVSVGGRAREYSGEILGAGDRKLGEGRTLEACTQAQAAKLEVFARSLESSRASPAPSDAAVQPVAITDDEMAALRRYEETCEDSQPYDVPAPMMKRLAEIGLVRRVTAAIYTFTDFGLAVVNDRFATSPLPTAPGAPQFKDVEGFLCRAWGESDLPEARLVHTAHEWQAFVVEAQRGPDAKYEALSADDHEMIDAQVRYIEHDMADNGTGCIEFEIGGVSVERVTFLRAALAAAPLDRIAPEWQPISIYDALQNKPRGAVFYLPEVLASRPGGYTEPEEFRFTRNDGARPTTQFLLLSPPAVEAEHGITLAQKGDVK